MNVNDLLEQILALLQAQDARIKELEAKIETGGVDAGDLTEILHESIDGEDYNNFAERHKEKFAPYIPLMDKLQGSDSMREIYNASLEASGEEGFNEDEYVGPLVSKTRKK